MLAGCPFIPTSVDCQNGLAAVQQMDSVFQSAPTDIQAQFQSAHDTIMSSYNQYSWYSCLVEINNGAVCDLGQQAATLMGQIQSAMGQSSTPGIPGGPGTDYMSLIIIGAVLYLALPFLIARK
jgi:hypothetical protein